MRINNFSSPSVATRGPVSQGFGISLNLEISGYLYRVEPKNGVISEQENGTENADHFFGKCYENIT